MEKIAKKYNFKSVWHFTDRSNLELIQKHGGLFSLKELQKRKINVPIPGSNQWSRDADKLKNVHKYVHLAFLDDHPMLFLAIQKGRIPNPVWLEIDSSILTVKGVRFCTDVSNKSGIEIFKAKKVKKQIDFDVLFTYMDWKDPTIQARRQAAIKSEILIPDFIPIKKIIGVKNG